MTTGLPDFFRHNLWANLRLIDACEQLSDAQLDATMHGTFGSVRATLVHMLSSEEGYVKSITGSSPTPRLYELTTFPGFDELRRRAELSGNELIRIPDQHDLDRILHLDEGTYDAAVMIVLLQSINHATDHRSQIASLLTQQGVEPPALDGWDYNDALRAG